jgi:dTDP-glucose pyrophosphorylase
MGLDIFFHHSIHLIPITKKPILTVSYTDFIKIGNIEICLLNSFNMKLQEAIQMAPNNLYGNYNFNLVRYNVWVFDQRLN